MKVERKISIILCMVMLVIGIETKHVKAYTYFDDPTQTEVDTYKDEIEKYWESEWIFICGDVLYWGNPETTNWNFSIDVFQVGEVFYEENGNQYKGNFELDLYSIKVIKSPYSSINPSDYGLDVGDTSTTDISPIIDEMFLIKALLVLVLFFLVIK